MSSGTLGSSFTIPGKDNRVGSMIPELLKHQRSTAPWILHLVPSLLPRTLQEEMDRQGAALAHPQTTHFPFSLELSTGQMRFSGWKIKFGCTELPLGELLKSPGSKSLGAHQHRPPSTQGCLSQHGHQAQAPHAQPSTDQALLGCSDAVDISPPAPLSRAHSRRRMGSAAPAPRLSTAPVPQQPPSPRHPLHQARAVLAGKLSTAGLGGSSPCHLMLQGAPSKPGGKHLNEFPWISTESITVLS